MLNLPRRSIVRAFIATLGVAAAAGAHADTWTAYPGASCTSDGLVTMPSDGSLLAVSPYTTGYQTFSCPIFRTFSDSAGSPSFYVYVDAKVNNGQSDFLCVLRATDRYGKVLHSDSHTFHKLWEAPTTDRHAGAPLTLPAVTSSNAGYRATLRCRVPNYPGVPAGIISYEVRN